MVNYKIFSKKEEKQICKEYFSEKRLSTDTLGKKWNCNHTTINNIIKRNDFILRRYGETNKIFTKKQELQICKEYLSKKQPSLATLSGKWVCNPTTIRDILIRNGFFSRKKSITNITPEAIHRVSKNGYGKKCYYNNEFFPSLQERDCYIQLIKLGYIVIHNFLGRFDFLVNGKIVVEFHPYDRNGLTNRQYYNQRRKLLDRYGYKNLKLVVIKDLKEIQKVLEKL